MLLPKGNGLPLIARLDECLQGINSGSGGFNGSVDLLVKHNENTLGKRVGAKRLIDSPFEVADHSLKEAAPEYNWEKKADAAIARSDIVIVMVGRHTHRAQGVIKEINMARNRNKKIVQVIGYKDGNYTAVPGAGRLYSWNWENLKNLLS